MTEIVSYAQNFEDVMLWRALGHVQGGCYVDIGAQSATVDSVSKLFHEKGWSGVHVDPVPAYAEELRRERLGDVVLQAAVGSSAGTFRLFEIAGTGLSTGHREIADRHASSGFKVCETVVPAITMDDVLASFDDKPVHWMKIDVEGGEHDVLEGWRESAVRPWVVVVESTAPRSQEQVHQEWEPLLVAKGYRFASFDGLNRFYVGTGHEDLLGAFECGPNVFDRFALSGTATSTFASLLNSRIARSEHELAERLAALQADSAARELQHQAEMQERLDSLRAEAHASQLDHEGSRQRMQQLVDSLQEQASAEKAQYAADRQRMQENVEHLRTEFNLERRTAQTAHEELLAQLDSERRAMQEASAVSGEMLQRALAALEAANSNHQAERQALQVERDALMIQLSENLRRSEWLEGERMLAQEQLRVRTDSENQWRLAAQAAGHEVSMLHASTSWRLTAPLRYTKILTGRALRFPLRVGRSVAFRSRRMGRTIAIRAMRYTLAHAQARDSTLALLDRFPRIKAPLRALAATSGLIGSPQAHGITGSARAPCEDRIPVARSPELSAHGNDVLQRLRSPPYRRRR